MMSTKTTPTPRTNAADLASEVRMLRDLAFEIESRAAAVERRLARGTGDVTEAARAAASQTPTVDKLSDGLRAARARASETPTSYFVGDEGPTQELYKVVERLISERPRSFRELLDITGARRGRVSGAIVFLQTKRGRRVENFGNDQRALWYLKPKAKRAH